MAAGGAEEHFAKKLANNDKKIRDRAVRRLQAWLASRPFSAPAFGEIELLKIWKGLFYCFWMSDKPLIQEELATNISKLIHSFKNTDSGFNFIVTFFKTFHKEWHGIDRLRLDKFYMIIRFFIKENFELLSKRNWESSLCLRLSSIYKEGPVNPTLDSVPVGIRLHLCSIFLTELQELKCKQIPCEAVTILLDPFFILAAQTKSQVVSRAVKEGVFEKILEIKSKHSEENHGNECCEDDEGYQLDEEKHNLKIDLKEITERLFALASDRQILGRNRNLLYMYIKKCKKLMPELIVPSDSKLRKRKLEEKEKNEEEFKSKLKKTEVGSAHDSEVQQQLLTTGDKDQVSDTKKQNQRKKSKIIKAKHQKENNEMIPNLEDSNEEVLNNSGEREKTRKTKRKKAKIHHDNNLESADRHSCNGLDDVNETQDNERKRKALDENQNQRSNIIDNTKNKQSLIRKSILNDGVSAGNLTKTQHELSTISHNQVSKQSFKNGVSEDELDKALKEMRQKISDTNAAVKTPLANKKKKDKKRKNMTPNAFATFMKAKTPPAYVKKTASQTEPKKTNITQLSTPQSAPNLSRKKVTIELSKNKAQTTLDYVKSLKTSPSLPFDASRSPAFGLLKIDSPKSTPKSKKFTPIKRSKAVDFF